MSHVTVNANTVIEVCQARIEQMNMYKVWNLANAVRYEANRKRWFGKPWGYQKAFDVIMDDRDMMMDIRAGNCYLNQVIDECECLITLAELGDPVVITDEHAYLFAKPNESK